MGVMKARQSSLTTIGFDADDTLWQNEHFYRLTEARFAELLGEHVDAPVVSARLLEAAKRNLKLYGFGIKSFTLSMIETAVEVTGGAVPGQVIGEILSIGRELLSHPIEMLPDARETVEALAGSYRLVLITKGDLFDQERKIAQSGARRIVRRRRDRQRQGRRRPMPASSRATATGRSSSMMVGNSLKSDIVPAIEAGSWGVYVPHELTWAAEHADAPEHHPRFRQVPHLGELAAMIAEIEGR